MSRIKLLRLGKLVRDERGDRGIRVAATDIGISPATLSRVERGKLPDLETFSRICTWLKVDPAEMLDIKTEQSKKIGDDHSSEEVVIAAHFRADSALAPEAAQDLAQLILAAQHALADKR